MNETSPTAAPLAIPDPILVTGGAGFFGSAFVRAALAAGARVVTLDALTYAGHTDNLGGALGDPRHTFVHGDVTDAKIVGRVLGEHRPAGIVHFAAETHVDRSIDEPSPFVTTNVLGTVRMLDAARAALARYSEAERARFRFVHISTDEVYGSAANGERFTESTPLAPRSPYAASKAAADGFVGAYRATFGFPATIVRLSNLYGPRQLAEKLIPLTVRRALAGLPIGVYGDGAHLREWLFVDDACEVLLAVLARGVPGAIYLAGAGVQHPNLQVVHAVCDLVDALAPPGETLAGRGISARRELIRHVTDRPGHDRAYALDTTATRAALGWQPRTPLGEGLARTVRWFVDHPEFFQRTAALYDGERLGLGGIAPSDVTAASLATGDVTASSATASGVTASGVTASGVTASGVTASGVTASGVTASGVTASGVTASGVTASGATANSTAPGGVTAGATPPASTAPRKRGTP